MFGDRALCRNGLASGTMVEMSDSVKVGLIGYGYAGRVLHAPLIQAVPGLCLTTVASSRTEEVRAALWDVRVCTPQELVSDSGLDLVVIATPNTEHFPLALAALESGKHVVVDKPFTLDLAEAEKLRAAALRHNRMLTVFHNRRWESEVLGLQQILASGALGRVAQFDCRMNRFRPNVRQRWRENPGPGAGLWFDLGPHMIDLALHFFGLPQQITTSLAALRDGGQTDDWAHVLLTYPDKRIVLEATNIASGSLPRSVLHGTQGTWVKYGLDTQEAQLQAGMSPLDPAFGIDPQPAVFYSGTGETTEYPAPRGNQVPFYAGVRDAILHHKPAPVSSRDALAVMAVLETTFRSAQQQRTLPLEFTMPSEAEWGEPIR